MYHNFVSSFITKAMAQPSDATLLHPTPRADTTSPASLNISDRHCLATLLNSLSFLHQSLSINDIIQPPSGFLCY
jgi:hypothetical protein